MPPHTKGSARFRGGTGPTLAGSHLFLRGKGRLLALDIGAAAGEADRER